MTKNQIGNLICEVVAIVIEDIVGGGIEARCDILEQLHEDLFGDLSAA